MRAHVGSVALPGASGFGDHCFIIVAKFLCQYVTANGTNLIVETICLGSEHMTERRSLTVRIGVAATGAGAGGVALFGTGGSCYHGIVIVPQSVRYSRFYQIALGTHALVAARFRCRWER